MKVIIGEARDFHIVAAAMDLGTALILAEAFAEKL